MSFPWHDPPWCEVGDLLDAAASPDDRLLAPDLFWWRFPAIWRYVPENLTDQSSYDWAVVHKGELPAIPRRFLEHLVATATAVLANEVFVVFAARPTTPPVDPRSPHLLAFVAALGQLPESPTVELAAVSDRVLEGSPTLRQFGAMNAREARAAQDEFFRTGGYRHPTARDRMYASEMRVCRDSVLRPGMRVLDLCCGSASADPLPSDVMFVRVDFSPVGVTMAAQADQGVSGALHVAGDAEQVPLASGAFDAVVVIDSMEHVFHPATVLEEVARVLRPGGELVLTYVNTNSINQMVTRALGHPTFLTNHQHINEFTYDEMSDLVARAGLTIERTDGVELRVFWGVPGLDHLVRVQLDDDEEFVEMTRVVGRRLGIEHAYVGVVHARKPAWSAGGDPPPIPR